MVICQIHSILKAYGVHKFMIHKDCWLIPRQLFVQTQTDGVCFTQHSQVSRHPIFPNSRSFPPGSVFRPFLDDLLPPRHYKAAIEGWTWTPAADPSNSSAFQRRTLRRCRSIFQPETPACRMECEDFVRDDANHYARHVLDGGDQC